MLVQKEDSVYVYSSFTMKRKKEPDPKDAEKKWRLAIAEFQSVVS